MLNKLKMLVVEEEGQGMSEYALVLGGVVVAAAGLAVMLRTELATLLTKIQAEFTKVNG